MFKLKTLAVICFGGMLSIGLSPIVSADVSVGEPNAVVVSDTTGAGGSSATPVGSEGTSVQTTGAGGSSATPVGSEGTSVQTTGVGGSSATPVGSEGTSVQTTGAGGSSATPVGSEGTSVQTTGVGGSSATPVSSEGTSVQTTGSGGSSATPVGSEGTSVQTTGSGGGSSATPVGSEGTSVQTTGAGGSSATPVGSEGGTSVQTTGVGGSSATPVSLEGTSVQTTGSSAETQAPQTQVGPENVSPETTGASNDLETVGINELPIKGHILILNGSGGTASVSSPGHNVMKSKDVRPSQSYHLNFMTFLSRVNPAGINLPRNETKTILVIEKAGRVCIPVINIKGHFSSDRKISRVETFNTFKFNSLGCTFSPTTITYLERRGGNVASAPTSSVGAPAAKFKVTIVVPGT